MKLVHDPADGTEQVLATTVETADSFLSRARGLMFRRSIPDDFALVFRFGSVGIHDVHMVFVPFPIDVVWTIDEEVQRVARLPAWTGLAKARGDQIVEFPAGAADDVQAGDRLLLRA